jgi:hypothetical protein
MTFVGLGKPQDENKAVESIIEDLLNFKGAHIEGQGDTAFTKAVNSLLKQFDVKINKRKSLLLNDSNRCDVQCHSCSIC